MINSSSVFVVSGGAKGVTAQCIIKLTQRFQCKSILLGRSLASEVEPDWAKDCFDQSELKRRIMQDFLSKGEKPTPVGIQKVLNGVLSGREIANTLQAIEQAGGKAEYLSVDVTNASDLQEKLPTAIKRLGSVTGIIHGAGNLADKLIEKKTEQDFETVYAAKVKGLENLLRCLPPSQIEYLVLFSSVAGFFGNAGQTDYAIANEILNKSAHLIKLHYPNCHVVAINWGPWDSGMVTPELKKAFAQRNIAVIPLEVGAEMLADELSNAYEQATQIIIGSPIVPTGGELSSVLQTYRIRRKLTLDDNPFLLDHQIGDHPVLPAVCAASWMINTCEKLYPGYKFSCMENFKVLKGIVFDNTQPNEFVVDIKEVAKNNTDEVVFEVLIWSEKAGAQINVHYQGQVRISTQLHYSSQVKIQRQPPSALKYDLFNNRQEKTVPGQILYQNGTLFHGACFQGIDCVFNLSSNKLTLQCIASQVTEKHQGQFPAETFNPYIADTLCQSILVWVKASQKVASLPLEIQRIEQFRPIAFDEKYYISTDIQYATATSFVAHATAHNFNGDVYLQMTNVKVTVSERLNHLFEKTVQKSIRDVSESKVRIE